MKKETREKLYKIGEVAEILGVHEDTLRNWEREGFIVPERIGKRKDRRYTAEMIGEIKKKGLVSDLAKKAPASKKDLDEYTKEELIKELQLLKKQKKYGLVWEDHVEEVAERCKTEAPILVAKKDKQIKDKDKPTNILIEGDNYHALQVLNYTHKGKINVIYIDPPYNTGNKDFIYNDHYVDKEDNFRHSKWLSFMESRLRLAKKLLKKDGVIFISIDDNEMAQLKLLCNGIFGEENFITNFIWRKKRGGGRGNGIVIPQTEYIFVYALNIQRIHPFEKELSEYKLKKYKYRDLFGKYAREGLDHHSPKGAYERKTLQYKLRIGNKKIYCPTGQWLWSRARIKKELNNFKINNKKQREYKYLDIILDNKKRWRAYKKIRLDDGDIIRKEVALSFIDNSSMTTNASAFEIKKIFKETVFNYSKPKDLMKYLVKFKGRDSTILDFMAGSGTTGHAVLDLNKEDGGNRKFILCTNNELNGLEKELREKGLSEEEIEEHGICRRITHKRIEKVMKGYTTPNGKKVKGLGGSLEYFKTEFVDVENIDKVSDKKKLEFTYEAGQMIALKEDAFKEVAKNKFYQIFTDEKDKFVGIYFRENLEKLAEMEKKILDKKDVKLYLFSYGVNDYKKDYTEYKNVTVKDIPEPILKIYKRLNN